MTKKAVYITKLSGKRQKFSLRKLERSLKRAGASRSLARRIAEEVADDIRPGMTTADIYQQAHYLLRQYERGVAVRYSLKRALLDLGPAGYPFEKLVGLLLKEYGYQVKINQIIPGKCSDYELDVIADKDGKRFFVECKFHNRAGFKCDIKTALYVWARFLDIKEKAPAGSQALLVTNTKLTTEALRYARCVGLKVISWDYPADYSLKKLIDQANFHPITALTSLSFSQKGKLLKKGIVLCRQLINNPQVLKQVGFSQARISRILNGAKEVIQFA